MSMMIRRHKVQNKSLETSKEVTGLISDTDKLSKTDIARMSKVDLISLAKKSGIMGADDMTGNELKSKLINLLGI